MTYDEATTAKIPTQCAIDEITRHGLDAIRKGRQLVEASTGDLIAKIDQFGDVQGRHVLEWLGY